MVGLLFQLGAVAVAAPADCDDTYRVPSNPLGDRGEFPDEPFVDDYQTGPRGSDPGGRIVVPSTGGKAPSGSYPTAWIVHGLGFPHDDYTVLQEHLAHVGIASVSIDTALSDLTGLEDDLQEHINTLHGSNGSSTSSLAPHLGDRIALVGHSMGGGLVVGAADAIASMSAVDLYSVVALAPNAEEEFRIDRDQAQGLLVVLGSDDADTAVNHPLNSGFLTYDISGDEASFSGTEKNRFTKSMVYVDGAEHDSHSDGAGAFQDVVHAYTVSYLLWSLRDEHDLHVFFKQAETLDGATDVQLQWTEPTYRSVLDNFEASTIANTMGGINVYPDVTAVKGDAYSADFDSPHHTRVLTVDWTSSGDPALHFNLGFPEFGLADHRDLTSRRYLSMRVGQEASANGSTDFSVVLEDGDGTTQSHPISAFGDVRETFGGVSRTDAAMETILVPLCAYDDIDRNKVVEVRLVFDRAGHSSGHIQLDNLEFID